MADEKTAHILREVSVYGGVEHVEEPMMTSDAGSESLYLSAAGPQSKVVARHVHRSAAGSWGSPFPPAELVSMLRKGLPTSELDDLKDMLELPMTRLADLLGVSKATLQRRKTGQLLGPDESDRVVRYARLLGKAVDFFDSEEAARQWLSAPQIGLAGETPLEFARSEVGAREVENLLGRMDTGVYS